jgi:hypothetical protein
LPELLVIVYDSAYLIAEQIMDDHNKMHKSMTYTLQKEENKTLNYLDLKLQRQNEKNYHRDLSQAYTN